LRSDSKTPLTPSPGKPNTTSTSQAISVSIGRSAVVGMLNSWGKCARDGQDRCGRRRAQGNLSGTGERHQARPPRNRAASLIAAIDELDELDEVDGSIVRPP